MSIFDDPNTLSIVADAARRNAHKDRENRGSNRLALEHRGVYEHLREAMTLIHDGIAAHDFHCVAEGFARLQEIHKTFDEFRKVHT